MSSAVPVTEKPAKEEWAIMVNVTEPVKDFHKQVPDMAHKVRHLSQNAYVAKEKIEMFSKIYQHLFFPL